MVEVQAPAGLSVRKWSHPAGFVAGWDLDLDDIGPQVS
jgi:hypothetical protein